MQSHCWKLKEYFVLYLPTRQTGFILLLEQLLLVYSDPTIYKTGFGSSHAALVRFSSMSPWSNLLLIFLSVRTFNKPSKNVEVTKGSDTPNGVFTKAPMDGYASVNLDHEAKHVIEFVIDKDEHLENPVWKGFVLCHKTALTHRTLHWEVFLEKS